MTSTQITYRKTKTGEWVAYGPAATVLLGPIYVAKKDGSVKAETVTKLGAPFTVDGRDMIYGYLATTETASTPSPTAKPAGRLASDKQVALAAKLINQGRWHDSDIGQGFSTPTVAELRKMTSADISAIIDDLADGGW